MATYNPASFPRRPKQNDILSEAKYQISLAYYRYEVNTGQYVMTAGEKAAYNMILFSFIAMFFFAVCYYFPRTTLDGLQLLVYYLTGSHRTPVNRQSVVPRLANDAVLGTSEAVASLSDHGAGMLNASTGFAG